MLNSMTGFADVNENYDKYQIYIEIKSLNHKYLNINYKINEELQVLEEKIYNLVSSKINRGKIDIKIKININDDNNEYFFNINKQLLKQLIKINDDLIEQNPKITPISVSNLLKFPNVIINNNYIEPLLLNKIMELITTLIEKLEQSKKNEGKKLAKNILTKVNELKLIHQQINIKIPKLIEQYQEKLRKRIENVALDIVQDSRLQQEFVYFIQKYDIEEELNRIDILLQDFNTIIKNNNYKPIGKKLDFIIQELNRETNTIASKSISIEITQLTINSKVLLEQIREQIQNIE